jgi:hypothetical protein
VDGSTYKSIKDFEKIPGSPIGLLVECGHHFFEEETIKSKSRSRIKLNPETTEIFELSWEIGNGFDW